MSNLRAVETLDSIASAKKAGLRYVSVDQPGLRRRKSRNGFIYLEPSGSEVRDAKTLERIRSLVIPPAWKDVWICPRENGHLQATGYDQRGRKQYRYHPSYRRIRDANKFGRMLAFADALPKIRRRLRSDLRQPGLTKNKVVAAVIHLLDCTCIRVGNEEYARKNDSFGLTTLQDRHVKVSGGRIEFHFRAKSGQFYECSLDDPRLAAIVKRCRDLPGYELFQYRDDQGHPADIHSTDINDYLKEITGDDFTAKDFRTWHGSGHALEYLANLDRARSKTQIRRNLLAAVKSTAKFLGNRPATCRKYYIHPAITDGYTEGTFFAVVDACEGTFGRRYEAAIRLLAEKYAQRAK